MVDSAYELLGFTFMGPPPLGVVHLRYTNGLVALYGKNGVGKTRLLAAIEALVTGRDTGGEAWMHLRLGDRLPTGFARQLFAERQVYMPEEWLSLEEDEIPDEFWETLDRTPTAITYDASWAVAVLQHHCTPPMSSESLDDPLFERVRAAISDRYEGHLSLTPNGRGGWETWFSLPPGTLDLHDSIRFASFRDNPPPDAEIEWFTRKLGPLLGGPPWVPIPLVRVAAANPRVGPRVVSAQSARPDEASQKVLLGGGGSPVSSDWFEVVFEADQAFLGTKPELSDFLAEMTVEANDLLATLLLNPPELRWRLLGPASWLDGQVARWEARDMSGSWVEMSELSTAQRRWSEIAIHWLLAGPYPGVPWEDTRPLLVLVDEPELALHPVAIDHLLHGLKIHLRRQPQAMAIAATHSPQVLAASSAPVHVIRGGSGAAVVSPLRHREELEATAESLGVRLVDLLQRYRVFLVVEGQHDRTVLSTIFGDEWERIRTRILLMQGASQAAPVAASEILLEFTEAHTVILLDNVRPRIETIWHEAQKASLDGHTAKARKALSALENDPGIRLGAEEQTALRFLRTAVSSRPDRLHLLGLPRADIIEYLPPEVFGLETSWESLRRDYDAAKAADPHFKHDFKSWLRKARSATISVKTIREASAQVAEPPPQDLTRIFAYCAKLATSSGPDAPPT